MQVNYGLVVLEVLDAVVIDVGGGGRGCSEI